MKRSKENRPQSPSNAPPALAAMQDWLRIVWTEPRGIDAALRRAPNLSRWIMDAPPIPTRTRLAVYSDAYFLRLLDCLSSDFAAIRRSLGQTKFRELAVAYLRAHPSKSPNVGDLGAALPAFVRRHAFKRELPFLAELAALERTVFESLYSGRLDSFDPESLKSVPAAAWSKARLILDPTVRLLALAWPVDRLWRSRDLPDGQGIRVLSRPHRRHLLIFRDDDWVQVRSIDAAPWLVLSELHRERTIGQACAALEKAGIQPKAAAIQQWFGEWIADGVVKRVEFR